MFINDKSFSEIERSILYNRKISKTPYKILDAPNLEDEYYQHVLDWSRDDLIGIVLQDLVYFFDNKVKKDNVIEVAKHNDSFYTSLKFSADGKTVVVGDLNGCLVVIDTSTQNVISSQKHDSDKITTIDWMSETVFSTGCMNGNVNTLDMRTRNFVNNFKAHQGGVCVLKWCKEENYLATGGNDNLISVWDPKK